MTAQRKSFSNEDGEETLLPDLRLVKQGRIETRLADSLVGPGEPAGSAAQSEPVVIEPTVSERIHLSSRIKALKNFGRSTHSFLTLYEGVKYFEMPGIKGYVPITESNGFILIIGEPVCDTHTGRFLMEALKRYADERNSALGAVPVGEKTRKFLADCGFKTLYVGREPIFDLTRLPKLSKSIRQAVNRVTKKGFRVIEWKPAENTDNYQDQMERLCEKWKASKELPPMGFLFELRPMELREHKKYFLLVDENNELRTFLSCSPILAKNGWYLEDLVRDGTAPNGCTELLVTEALKILSAEGFQMATLGLAPLAGLPEYDEERPGLNKILRFVYEHGSFIYHFQALDHFKAKFHPQTWEKNYLCHYTRGSKLTMVKNLLSAFIPCNWQEVLQHKLQKWKKS